MAAWDNMITLISEREPEEQFNANGFENETIKTEKDVYCNKRSVSQGEFYKAQQAGILVEMKIEIHSFDYSGEMLARFEGKTYSIFKTYEQSNDIVELTLTDLKHEGG